MRFQTDGSVERNVRGHKSLPQKYVDVLGIVFQRVSATNACFCVISAKILFVLTVNLYLALIGSVHANKFVGNF
jgi:hypothetical protein